MRNVFAVLKSGGSFIMTALRGSDRYLVGEHWFPATNLDRNEFEAALLQIGSSSDSLTIVEQDTPDDVQFGCEGVMLACGRKR
jgi:hypothetical protein